MIRGVALYYKKITVVQQGLICPYYEFVNESIVCSYLNHLFMPQKKNFHLNQFSNSLFIMHQNIREQSNYKLNDSKK